VRDVGQLAGYVLEGVGVVPGSGCSRSLTL
jgi:hypothetical protein